MIVDISRFRDVSRRVQAATMATALFATVMLPVVVSGSADAAPALANRKLESSSAVPGGATNLTWSFGTTSAVANVNQIEIEFCSQPLTGCDNTTNGGADTGTDTIPVLPALPTATITGTNAFNGPTPSSVTRGTGRSNGANNQITIVIPSASGTSSTGTIAITGFTNDSEINKSYYTRMRMYSDTGTTLVWEGVFAQSTSQTLTVNARVQERLDFCVGATTVDSPDGVANDVGDCGTMAGTSVDIGNVENGKVNVSPVTTTNGGSNNNGVAFIRTNAVNGASVAYRSLSDTSSGTLKVPGTTCNAVPSTVIVDQCFNTAITQGVLSAGTELFGMTIAGINCKSTNAYACAFTTGNYNLLRDAAYDGTGSNTYPTTDLDQINSTTAGYAWQADPTQTTTIASSAGTMPTTGFRVIDNEALILKFAATAAVTTPTGAYSVQADFIATTTF